MLVRRKNVVHRRRAPACDASCLLPPFLADATCISKQLSPNLQQGNAAGAVLHTGRHCDKTLRQDTAVRHYGKAIRQALRKDSPEDTADTCGKAQRQNTAAGITARRHHDKTLRQKYTAALWQESATCGKKVRHVSWHCGMLLRLNRKKTG